MSYRIRVERVETNTVMRRQWERVRSAELAKELGLDKEYDYVDITKEEASATLVYDQTTQNLDLSAVIKAVNGIA